MTINPNSPSVSGNPWTKLRDLNALVVSTFRDLGHQVRRLPRDGNCTEIAKKVGFLVLSPISYLILGTLALGQTYSSLSGRAKLRAMAIPLVVMQLALLIILLKYGE